MKMMIGTCEITCNGEKCVVRIGTLYKPFESFKEAFLWLLENQNQLYAASI